MDKQTIDVTKTLVRTLFIGAGVGAAQLGSGMFLTLRGKRNIEETSKTVTKIATGRTSKETLRAIGKVTFDTKLINNIKNKIRK